MASHFSVWWNLFLGVVPVVLAYALAWGLAGRGKQRNLPLFVCVPLTIAWLAFLSNTCYLLTEWRHLLFDPRWAGLLESGRADHYAMLSTAKWALFFLAYSGTGLLLFVLSIRPMERWVRSSGHVWPVYAPLFFFLISFGVYLGLIPRLNSWDLLQRPLVVWRTTFGALANPTLLTSIAIFSILLWATYEAVDLWVDGLADRLKRWGFAGSFTRLRTAP